MRTGFNGIWQTCEDSNGLFATPAGLLNQKSLSQIIDAENIKRWSAALRTTQLHTGSYIDMTLPSHSSLIYLDPPYRGSFTSYGTGFSDADQAVLAAWYRDRVNEGHKVLLANRCVDDDGFFEDLIGDIASFHYFDVTYTAGRRKLVDTNYEAKAAREFIAISN
jgi:DNA adenine methylase